MKTLMMSGPLMSGLLISGLLLGCGDKETTGNNNNNGDDTGSTEESDTDTDADTDADPDTDISRMDAPEISKQFIVSWKPQVVQLVIFDLGGGGGGGGKDTAAPPNPDPNEVWHFGMAETTGCDGDCWTGEDCYQGATVEGETVTFCHNMGRGGGALTYGAGLGSVQEGVNTAFPNATVGPKVTYFLENVSSGDCWAWGERGNYYSELGCTLPPNGGGGGGGGGN